MRNQIRNPVSGNSCIFCLFLFCNLLLLVVGLGTMSAGISVCAELQDFKWYNGTFIALGFFTALLSLMGHQVRFSVPKITIYLILMVIIFSSQLGFTLAIIFYTHYEELLGEEYANSVRYCILGACVVIFCCFFIGFCYRRSLVTAKWYDREERLLQTVNMGPIETPKTDAKREEMMKKYPALAKAKEVRV